MVNLQTAGVWLFESSLVQLRSNEDLEGPECTNYSQSCKRCKSLAATFLDQQSGQSNKVKEHNIRSTCRQQLFGSLRAHQYSSDQMKILKDQSAQNTPRVVSVANCLRLPLLINRVVNLTKLRSIIYNQSVDSSCLAL